MPIKQRETADRRALRHARRRQRVKLVRVVRFADPRYHLRKLLEDIRHCKTSLNMWQLDKAQDELSLRGAIRGKLFGTYLASSLFAGIGPWIGYGIQVNTGRPTLGFFSGMLFAILIGMVSYQVIWMVSNKAFYAHRFHGDLMGRIRALFQDLIPMQLKSLQITVLMNIVMLPIVGILLGIVETRLSIDAKRFLPINLIATLTEFVLIQSTCLRLMGDLFERHSKILARKYSPNPSLDQQAS